MNGNCRSGVRRLSVEAMSGKNQSFKLDDFSRNLRPVGSNLPVPAQGTPLRRHHPRDLGVAE